MPRSRRADVFGAQGSAYREDATAELSGCLGAHERPPRSAHFSLNSNLDLDFGFLDLNLSWILILNLNLNLSWILMLDVGVDDWSLCLRPNGV